MRQCRTAIRDEFATVQAVVPSPLTFFSAARRRRPSAWRAASASAALASAARLASRSTCSAAAFFSAAACSSTQIMCPPVQSATYTRQHIPISSHPACIAGAHTQHACCPALPENALLPALPSAWLLHVSQHGRECELLPQRLLHWQRRLPPISPAAPAPAGISAAPQSAAN